MEFSDLFYIEIRMGDNAEYDEILARLTELLRLSHAGNPNDRRTVPAPIPLIDPTANVSRLVELSVQHISELRAADKENDKVIDDLREKLSIAESKRIDASNLAEARRLDAVLAEQKAAVALASEKNAAQAAQLAGSVVAAAATTASSMESLRTGFDNRVGRLEQSQQLGAGKTEGRSDTYRNVQSVIVLLLTLAAFAAGHFVFK